jgi:predicted HicB family RNase H-like nuclease
MADAKKSPRRPRGQGYRATKRLSETPLDKNMVVRCSDTLYEAAQNVASAHDITLSDYVRELIIRDVEKSSHPPTMT